ncbi:MAG: PD-(D/E)XK nuclease family protein, partial [Clostridia bacterium]|nr:PD-(D/E)XK nuclease family protein [Clostridia bacterium]
MQSEDKPKERNSAAEPIRIGVRALAEYVHRTGGLSPVGFSDLTAQDGTRAHQRFFKSFAPEGDASDFRSEVYLEGSFEEQDVAMRITGRIDAVVRTPGSARATVRIIEAKTVSGTLDAVQAGGDPVHWAQAMLYAWMYAESVPEEDVTQVSLYYLTADTGDTREFNRQVTRPELDRFYTDTCRAYVRWASDVLRYRQARDLSAVSVRFPYPSVRSGQKPFMNQVLDAVRQKSAMLIQAPTGTGKTMSALYPAVKAVAHHLTDNVFYLTAKASTRIVAENAMDDLRRKGLVMKSITLFAKESLCPVPDLYCETRQCPYATQYHENLHAAMDRLMTFPSVSRDNLLACAETYKVCPFELSLDFSLYCDVIICDYNYAFDPRVRLVRYFDESVDARRLLLVDEAHNLPDRSREMFSAEIGETALRDMAGVLEGIDPALDKAVKALTEHFDGIIGGLNSDRPFLDGLEEGVMPADILSAEAFRSTRARPARLCGRL